jgi:predicted Na+-dependent transporter
MIFHQMQLIVCAIIARNYGDRTEAAEDAEMLGETAR